MVSCWLACSWGFGWVGYPWFINSTVIFETFTIFSCNSSKFPDLVLKIFVSDIPCKISLSGDLGGQSIVALLPIHWSVKTSVRMFRAFQQNSNRNLPKQTLWKRKSEGFGVGEYCGRDNPRSPGPCSIIHTHYRGFGVCKYLGSNEPWGHTTSGIYS